MKLSGRQLRQIIREELGRQYDLPPLSPKELERINKQLPGDTYTHPSFVQSQERREKRVDRPRAAGASKHSTHHHGDYDRSDWVRKGSAACAEVRVPKNDPFVSKIYKYLLKSTPSATSIAAQSFLGVDDIATVATAVTAKKASEKLAAKFIPIVGWVTLGADVSEIKKNLADARSQDICELLKRLDLAYFGSITQCKKPSDCEPISLRDWQTKYSAYLLSILNFAESIGYGPVSVVQGFVRAGWLRGSEAIDLKNLIERPDTTAQKEAT